MTEEQDICWRELIVQAGVDEVGRGCLAGPVVAAAVVLFNEVEGLKDSKQLTPIKEIVFVMKFLKMELQE